LVVFFVTQAAYQVLVFLFEDNASTILIKMSEIWNVASFKAKSEHFIQSKVCLAARILLLPRYREFDYY
ncbi:MAG: hypothetical protein WCF06_16090, partial [Nitrososphaeraceae archaeon]